VLASDPERYTIAIFCSEQLKKSKYVSSKHTGHAIATYIVPLTLRVSLSNIEGHTELQFHTGESMYKWSSFARKVHLTV
jgi:hypothetical protein